MIITSLLQQLEADDLTGDIIKNKNQIKPKDTPPLIDDLEMSSIFKDENGEEGDGVMDGIKELVLQTVGLLF